MNDDPFLRAVQLAIAEVNLFRAADDALDESPDAELAARLDSLGTVNLLLATESQLDLSIGKTLSLTDLLADEPERRLATVASFAAAVRAHVAKASA